MELVISIFRSMLALQKSVTKVLVINFFGVLYLFPNYEFTGNNCFSLQMLSVAVFLDDSL